jgi:hypothetical protein
VRRTAAARYCEFCGAQLSTPSSSPAFPVAPAPPAFPPSEAGVVPPPLPVPPAGAAGATGPSQYEDGCLPFLKVLAIVFAAAVILPCCCGCILGPLSALGSAFLHLVANG